MDFTIEKTVVNAPPRKLKTGYILIDGMPFRMQENYTLLDEVTDVNGKKLYSVRISNKVSFWLKENYVENVDYTYVRQIKGVWVDMPEQIFIILKLKWTK